MNRTPPYAGLLRKRCRLLASLATWSPILRGSLREHFGRCGYATCRCRAKKNPILHGPYQYLSHRYRNRTQTILLTNTKRPYAQAWVANYRRLIQTVYELCEVNFQLLRYHYDKLVSPK